MPISFFEGIPEGQDSDRDAERRLLELVAAVRDHEAASRRAIPSSRGRDERLYRRLRQINGERAGASRRPRTRIPTA